MFQSRRYFSLLIVLYLYCLSDRRLSAQIVDSFSRPGADLSTTACVVTPSSVYEMEDYVIEARGINPDMKALAFGFREPGSTDLIRQASPRLAASARYLSAGKHTVDCSVFFENGQMGTSQATFVVKDRTELLDRSKKIEQAVKDIYATVYRLGVAEGRDGIVDRIDSLLAFLDENCEPPPQACSISGDSKRIGDMLHRVKAAIQDGEPRSVILAEALILSKDFGPSNVSEIPDAIQKHRSRNANNMKWPGVPPDARLAAEYETYRAFIRRTSFFIESEVRTPEYYSDSDLQVQDLSDLGWSRKLNGERYQVIGTIPMFDLSGLKEIVVHDSDYTNWATMTESYDPFMYSQFNFAPEILPFSPQEVSLRFAPMDDVLNGRAITTLSIAMAESGLLFGCKVGDYYFIRSEYELDRGDGCRFFSMSKSKGSEDFQVFFCVVHDDVEHDVPDQCVPFIVRRKGQVWIAAIDKITQEAEGDGESLTLTIPGPNLSFAIYSNDPQFSSVLLFARALELPLAAMGVHVTHHSLSATTPQRYSFILSTKRDPWHEWVKLSFNEDDCEDDPELPKNLKSLKAHCVEIYATLLVNKQQDSDLTSWHPAPSYLSEKWTGLIRQTFLKSLKDLCKGGSVVGDRIVCRNSP